MNLVVIFLTEDRETLDYSCAPPGVEHSM